MTLFVGAIRALLAVFFFTSFHYGFAVRIMRFVLACYGKFIIQT